MRLTPSRPAAVGLALLMFVTVVPFPVFADEGMFLPDALDRATRDKLKKRGLKRVAQLCRRCGVRPPEISIRDNAFAVTFRLPIGTDTRDNALASSPLRSGASSAKAPVRK